MYSDLLFLRRRKELKLYPRLFLGVCGTACISLAPAYTYQYDDGTSEQGLSTSGPATYTALFITNYTIAAGAQTLTAIDIVWGAHSNPNLPNGLTADVLLLSDPNNDGDPTDDAILQSITTTTVNV